MNDASNFPESEQPEHNPTASDAAQETDANTSAQAQTPADDNAAAARTCPQCGAALKPGASFCANCGAPVDDSDDVTYHIVRPEAERSYEDANFQPSGDAANTPPRYYTPDADAWAEKPKRKRRARRPRTARTPEQKRLITRIACLCLVCALLGGLGGGAVAGLINRSGKSAGSAASASSGTLVTQPVKVDTSSASSIYDLACKQVVAITTEVTYTNYFGQTSSQASCGSGFFITEDGYVLTNYHVISTAHQYGYAVSVLTYDGTLCDARFSKSCGGVFEQFENCWEPKHYHYLVARLDNANAMDYPDLTVEENAREWILSSPAAFCNTTDKKILSQVLNNYDQETTDFYRWKVEYTQEELSALILKRSGIDYGQIIDLIPIARGTSGRLWKLKIVGTKRTLTIGKELEIRRTLSTSHLYSSAFVVDKEELSAEGIPGRFILTGAGWGHGVGLCQIGAAVMGEQGYKYDAILLHYYIGASIDKLYE